MEYQGIHSTGKDLRGFWKPQRSKKDPKSLSTSGVYILVLGTLYFVQLSIFLRHSTTFILIQVDLSHSE